MSCTLGNIHVEFLKSGIVIQARELSTRSNRSRYAHARITVSKAAGNLIHASALANEPVLITFDGAAQNRYIYPPDTLRVEDDSARFKLYDCRKILDHGTFSKHYNEVSIQRVLNDIFRVINSQDKYRALVGWNFTDAEFIERERQNSREDIVEALHGKDADAENDGIGGYVNKFLAGVADTGNALVDLTKQSYRVADYYSGGVLPNIANEEIENERGGFFAGISFDNVTPNDVLTRIEDDYGFSSWVDDEGVLWIGYPEGAPSNYHGIRTSVSGEKPYALKNYNAVTGATNISYVRVQGVAQHYVIDDRVNTLYPIAEAYVAGPDGEAVPGAAYTPENPRKIWDLDALETSAGGLLVNHSMNYRSGNLTINGTASFEKEKIANMSVGDVMMVTDFVEHCRGVEGGLFAVTEVQHRVSESLGWQTTVEVGEIPTDVVTEAFYYDPDRDEAYTSLEDYEDKEFN